MERISTAYFKNNGEKFFEAKGEKHSFTESTGPYEYLLGALAGCFYSTLMDQERKSGWEEVRITVKGRKRKEVPTVLEYTALELCAKGVEDKEEFQRLVQKTTTLCSIYQTLRCVSTMDTLVIFED